MARTRGDQTGFPCVFMRGGTSRGAFFDEAVLPADPAVRDAVLLAAYGSPDVRQIDGIGGADPLTSKAIIVSRSARTDCDVEYTFAQIAIDKAEVSYGGNCGNMLAAVGPYAIDEGLVEAVEPTTHVRIFNRNTGTRIVAEVPVSGGRAQVDGTCRIAGVASPGGRILLNFLDVAGAVTQRLLPTGNVVDVYDVDGVVVRGSLIDAATPFVFVPAVDLGLTGTELPDAIAQDAVLLRRLDAIRRMAGARIGLEGDAARNIPRIAMVTAPVDYTTIKGDRIAAGESDLIVRQMTMGRPHRTLAVTGSICVAVATRLAGTIPNLLAITREAEAVSLGHPSGVIRIEVDVADRQVRRAAVERTARRLMDGTVYIPSRVLTLSPV